MHVPNTQRLRAEPSHSTQHRNKSSIDQTHLDVGFLLPIALVWANSVLGVRRMKGKKKKKRGGGEGGKQVNSFIKGFRVSYHSGACLAWLALCFPLFWCFSLPSYKNEKEGKAKQQKTQRSELLAASLRLLSTCSCAHGDALSREEQTPAPPLLKRGERKEKKKTKKQFSDSAAKTKPFGHPGETFFFQIYRLLLLFFPLKGRLILLAESLR